jgi:hypothetical protein
LHDHRPLRVLVVGDSTSFLFAKDVAPVAAADGVSIYNEGTVGCGLAVTGLVREKLVPITDLYGGYVSTSCKLWPQFWAAGVTQQHPDVVVLMEGVFEVRDHLLDGHWTHIGNADFDSFEKDQLNRAITVLSSQGARVAVFTSPYFDQGEQLNGSPWPEDLPSRVREFNHLVSEVVAQHPANAAIVDFGRALSPDDRYAETIRGVQVRDSGGVHQTPAGDRLIAPGILVQVIHLAPP